MAANHGSTLTALAAAHEARVRRFLLMSVPGAHPEADLPFQRAKGLAEEAVSNSGLEHAIIRSTHAYGLGGLWFTAADDREGDLAGTWALEGSDVITPLGLGERLVPGGSPPVALSPAQAAERLTSALGVPVSITATEHFAAPSRADAPDAASEFGVALTPLESGLRHTMQRGAAAGR